MGRDPAPEEPPQHTLDHGVQRTVGLGEALGPHPEKLLEVSLIAGHRGALLLSRQTEGDSRTEFLVITLWDSMPAVRAFVGPDPDRAVVEPAARAVLADYDTSVKHYDVVLDTRDRSRGRASSRRKL